MRQAQAHLKSSTKMAQFYQLRDAVQTQRSCVKVSLPAQSSTVQDNMRLETLWKHVLTNGIYWYVTLRRVYENKIRNSPWWSYSVVEYIYLTLQRKMTLSRWRATSCKYTRCQITSISNQYLQKHCLVLQIFTDEIWCRLKELREIHQKKVGFGSNFPWLESLYESSEKPEEFVDCLERFVRLDGMSWKGGSICAICSVQQNSFQCQ